MCSNISGFINQFLIVSFCFLGWGTIYFGGAVSDTLQEANIQVWDTELCRANYADLNRVVTDNMICAGDVGKDACQVILNT